MYPSVMIPEDKVPHLLLSVLKWEVLKVKIDVGCPLCSSLSQSKLGTDVS